MYNMEEMKKVLTYEEFIKFRRKCRLLKAQQQTQPFLEENLGRLEPIVIQNEGTSPLFLEKEPNPFEHLQLHSQAHSQAQAVSELPPTATSGFGAHLLLSDFDESFLADRALDLKSDSMEGFRHSSNYLKTLLESCVGGRALLTYYQRCKQIFDNKYRSKLTNLIITAELQNPERRLDKRRFQFLANQITKVFPTETADVYYHTALSLGTGKYHPAGGRLFHAYHNRLKDLKKCGLLRNNVQRSRGS